MAVSPGMVRVKNSAEGSQGSSMWQGASYHYKAPVTGIFVLVANR